MNCDWNFTCLLLQIDCNYFAMIRKVRFQEEPRPVNYDTGLIDPELEFKQWVILKLIQI